MRKLILTVALLASAATPAIAQDRAAEQRFEAAQTRFDRELSTYRAEVDAYRSARANYRGNGYNNNGGGTAYNNGYDDDANYDASRYYRDGTRYPERTLASEDKVYRGTDGRYYCKRNDGTTGLIVGALGGGILGNVIDGGRSRTVGTILGALAGGVAGRAVERGQDQNSIRCR